MPGAKPLERIDKSQSSSTVRVICAGELTSGTRSASQPLNIAT